MTLRPIRLIEVALCGLITVAGASSIAVLRGQDATPGAQCIANVKQLSTAMLMYAGDYDGGLPLKKAWSDTVSPYVKSKSSFHCPSVAAEGFGYAYNFVCSSHNLSQLGKLEKMAVIFDTTKVQKDIVTTLVELPRPGRHEGKDTIGYLDGHVVALEERR